MPRTDCKFLTQTYKESSEKPSDAMNAVKQKDGKKLASLLETGLDSDAAAEALNAAITEGYAEGVDIILKHKPELAKSQQPEQPILTAAKSGASEKIINLLISNGSDINAKDDSNMNKTPLILASSGGHVETVEALLKHPECDRNAKSDPPNHTVWLDDFHTGRTALLLAIDLKRKGAPVVEALLRHGTDINITAETKLDGEITPLMHAAKFGLTNVVDMLLKAGAEVDRKDGSSQTALHWAVKGAQLDKHSEPDVIRPLINAGADLNAVSNCGGDNITPVQRAADIGTYLAPIGHDLTEALIEAGSEINRRDMYGKTLLHRAIDCGWNDIIDMLFARGVDVTICDYSDHSVMYDAVSAYQANTDTLSRLLDWNCDVTKRMTLLEQCNIRIPNQTLLEIALHKGSLDILPMLLAAGSPYHSVDLTQYKDRVVMVEDTYKWLLELQTKPHTLKNASRIALRRALPIGCHLESVLSKLPLPSDLRDFVLLRSGLL